MAGKILTRQAAPAQRLFLLEEDLLDEEPDDLDFDEEPDDLDFDEEPDDLDFDEEPDDFDFELLPLLWPCSFSSFSLLVS